MTRPLTSLRRLAIGATIMSFLVAGSAWAGSAPAGLAGRVMFDGDGTPDNWSVVLIDDDGGEAARGRIENDGRFRIDSVEPGTYLMALGDGDGRYAPVLDDPLVLTPATVERRDVRVASVTGDPLAQNDEDPIDEEAAKYSRLRIWWVGLSKGKKAGTILGIVGGAGLTWALLDDDDDPASPTVPDPAR